MTAVPVYDTDLFTDEVLAAPEEHHRALRELGPVVWLEAHGTYVLTRYDEVRAALRDPETFCSGRGVGLNDVVNEQAGGSIIMTDGKLHDSNRKLEFGSLTPKALNSIKDSVEQSANELVDRLVDQGRFDAISELAQALPLTVVPALLGWPDQDRDALLDWAAASFDVLGPMNKRAEEAVPRLMQMIEHAVHLVQTGAIAPGSVGARILEAAERGDISWEQAPGSLLDYLAPSVDTTISAIGHAVHLFSQHPDQWQEIREDPKLIPQAFNEVLRLEAPIRLFSRVTTQDAEIGGTTIPADSRVIIHYASANRDERQFAEPDRFDIHRQDSSNHLTFGVGTHTCPGQSLAKLESHTLLASLAERVETFELAGTPKPVLNNLINGWAELPVTVTPVAATSALAGS